jgi:DNA polymerase III delta subunit
MMENGKRHREVAQRAPPTNKNDKNPDNRRRWSQDELYRIPPALVAEIEAWLRASLRQ